MTRFFLAENTEPPSGAASHRDLHAERGKRVRHRHFRVAPKIPTSEPPKRGEPRRCRRRSNDRDPRQGDLFGGGK